MYDSGVQAYNKMNLNVVSKEKLLIMAYEHAIKFLKMAIAEQKKRKFYESFQFVLKSKKIIRELQNSLNMEIEEISMPLFRLYEYMDYRLNQVNVGLGVLNPINEVLELLGGMKETWVEAIKKEMEKKGSVTSLTEDGQTTMKEVSA